MISLGQIIAGTGLAAGGAGLLWVAAGQPPAPLRQPVAKGPPATAIRAAADELVIVASAEDPLVLMAQVRQRRLADLAGLRTIRSNDCAGLRPGIYVAAVPVVGGRHGPALAAARQKAADAYVRTCTFRSGSIAARALPAVDLSFARLSGTPVNWSSRDALVRIDSGLVLRPWFSPVADDPREGLRVAVETLPGDGRPGRVVIRDCTQPEVAVGTRYLAVACVNEIVLEQPVYRTRIYRADTLEPVMTVERCRRPTFPHPERAQCMKQDIGSDGDIAEAPEPIPLR